MARTVELLTIGDEILTGHTVDTNASWLAGQLTEAGFTILYQSSVGDDLDTMESAIRLAMKRADIVIATGGLGPTDDDLTKRAIVKVFKRNLIFHEDILESLKQRYAARGIEMPAINQNQALLPQGATFFPNKLGSAVGICIVDHDHHFIALPGVPKEMKQIVSDEVLPYLKGLGIDQAISIIKLRTTGIIESKLAEMITPELKLESGVRLAYLPSYSGVDLRVIATGSTQQDAESKATRLAGTLERVCDKYLYGNDDDTLEGVVGSLLVARHAKLAVAESCTGGQLGMTITSVAGSSDYFVGGVLAYSNVVKKSQLGVSDEIFRSHGAVSEECAKAMAVGVKNLLRADFALSVTGVAGPGGGTLDKPVGLTWIGLATPHGVSARSFRFSSDRQVNRTRAVYSALEMLRRELLGVS
jgi:nicotinamide-nucleotide amidase